MKLRKFVSALVAVTAMCSALSAQLVQVSAADAESKVVYQEDFESYGTQTLLEHKMDSEAAVNAVKDNYVSRVSTTTTTTEFHTDTDTDSACMKVDQGGKWSSAGFKYDITELVKDKKGELTISADVKRSSGGDGSVTIGFIIDDSESAASSTEHSNVSSSAFTTVTHTVSSIPSYNDKIYFLINTGAPVEYIKNVVLTFTPSAESVSNIPPDARWYSMVPSIVTGSINNTSGNYLKLTHSNSGADNGQGAIVDLSGLGIENGDKLRVSLTVATDNGDETQKLVQVFVKGAESIDDLNTNFLTISGATANGGTDGWVKRAGNGHENTYYNSSSANVAFDVDPVVLEDGENPYLCVMMGRANIYIDNIVVTLTKAEPETTEAGFQFAEIVSTADLNNKSIYVTKTENGETLTSNAIPFTSTTLSGEAEVILGIVITDIPAGVTIDKVEIR